MKLFNFNKMNLTGNELKRAIVELGGKEVFIEKRNSKKAIGHIITAGYDLGIVIKDHYGHILSYSTSSNESPDGVYCLIIKHCKKPIFNVLKFHKDIEKLGVSIKLVCFRRFIY